MGYARRRWALQKREERRHSVSGRRAFGATSQCRRHARRFSFACGLLVAGTTFPLIGPYDDAIISCTAAMSAAAKMLISPISPDAISCLITLTFDFLRRVTYDCFRRMTGSFYLASFLCMPGAPARRARVHADDTKKFHTASFYKQSEAMTALPCRRRYITLTRLRRFLTYVFSPMPLAAGRRRHHAL